MHQKRTSARLSRAAQGHASVALFELWKTITLLLSQDSSVCSRRRCVVSASYGKPWLPRMEITSSLDLRLTWRWPPCDADACS